MSAFKFDRGSLEHRMMLASRVRLRLALATAELDFSPRSCVVLRVVLGELLRRADVRGICWPSSARIAFDVELARSTVVSAIRVLVSLGVISRRPGRPKPGSPERRSTVYSLNWPRLDELAGLVSVVQNDAPDLVPSARSTGARAPAVRARERPQYGRASARSTVRNVSIERSPQPPVPEVTAQRPPAVERPAVVAPSRRVSYGVAMLLMREARGDADARALLDAYRRNDPSIPAAGSIVVTNELLAELRDSSP